MLNCPPKNGEFNWCRRFNNNHLIKLPCISSYVLGQLYDGQINTSKLRAAAKKLFFLVVRPLRGGGAVKAGPLKKKM